MSSVATSVIAVATDAVVAVAALPVVEPDDPDTFPVTFPVTSPVIGKVDVIAVVDIVSLFVPPVVNPIESAAACHIPVF